MRTAPRFPALKVAAAILAVVLVGLGVRLLLVHVGTDVKAPPGCEVVTGFWNGDEVLC